MSAEAPRLESLANPTIDPPLAESPAGVCPLLVVIVNYKTAALTSACLETLGPELEHIPGAKVTVVENASGDGEALARTIAERDWGGWVDSGTGRPQWRLLDGQ